MPHRRMLPGCPGLRSGPQECSGQVGARHLRGAQEGAPHLTGSGGVEHLAQEGSRLPARDGVCRGLISSEWAGPVHAGQAPVSRPPRARLTTARLGRSGPEGATRARTQPRRPASLAIPPFRPTISGWSASNRSRSGPTRPRARLRKPRDASLSSRTTVRDHRRGAQQAQPSRPRHRHPDSGPATVRRLPERAHPRVRREVGHPLG